MKNNKTTLVIGVSENPARISNVALRRLKRHGHSVIAIGSKAGFVDDTPIHTNIPENLEVDTVTLYIRPEIQETIKNNILNVKMRRMIFNPGTENPSLETEARKLGIITENNCMLVLLSLGEY